MKITRADIELWNAKKAPAFIRNYANATAAKGQKPSPRDLIETCINFRMPVGSMEENSFLREAGNLLAFLRRARKSESLIPTLRRIMTTSSHIPGSTKRRRSYALRWYKRAMMERINQTLRGFSGTEAEREAFELRVFEMLKLDDPIEARGAMSAANLNRRGDA